MRISLLSIISIISILVNDDMALEIPKNFGCKNSMISDDWRRAVLNYHNTLRKKVAEGKQRTNGNKANMLYATKMNELTWDCGLEHNAWLNLCDSNVKIDQDYTETTKTALNTKGTPCNVTARTLDILKAFSKESNEEDLSAANPTRTDKIANFAVMAAEAAKGFACTYQKCTGDTVTNFVCLYDTKMVANNQIYTTDADVTKICDACAANGNNAKCISHLCQYEYTLADKALPKADCTDDGMTLDMQNTAKYMHNYYRKVIASGWAKDKNGYAPRAKNMNELKYDCANMGADTLGTIDCAKHQYTAKGGNSLNYKEYSWEVTPADALQKAISEWYGELENVDLDEQSTYNQQIKTNANKFANMAVAEATKFACAAKQCKAQGHTVAVCQYNYPPDDDTPLYEVGKPCAGCDKATTTCDQMVGLCVTK